MFASIDDVIERFAEQQLHRQPHIATVVYLASQLEKPILVEGPAGVGKTELAKVLAAALGRELIRLQCYEGLDEAKALYEWEYAKQLLYTQILQGQDRRGARRARRSLQRGGRRASPTRTTSSSATASCCRARCCGRSRRRAPCVLLIDEIDKSDTEFEAFLLEVLSDFQVSVPELGTLKARAHADRRAHQQQRARDVRRAQAPLPAPLHRLPRQASRSSRSSG